MLLCITNNDQQLFFSLLMFIITFVRQKKLLVNYIDINIMTMKSQLLIGNFYFHVGG